GPMHAGGGGGCVRKTKRGDAPPAQGGRRIPRIFLSPGDGAGLGHPRRGSAEADQEEGETGDGSEDDHRSDVPSEAVQDRVAQRAAEEDVIQGGNQRFADDGPLDRKSTRLNSSHVKISYAVFCLKTK